MEEGVSLWTVITERQPIPPSASASPSPTCLLSLVLLPAQQRRLSRVVVDQSKEFILCGSVELGRGLGHSAGRQNTIISTQQRPEEAVIFQPSILGLGLKGLRIYLVQRRLLAIREPVPVDLKVEELFFAFFAFFAA